ncbi:MAG: glycosyltransferase family 4 protein [Niveispirillum sp.]|uniref:glycosyltransferase family 4 protein n=1 Tax=Niveispirillum sp. TaxID=1917217 RepID=UPI0040356E9C
MNVLFVHQNFPGQFKSLAPAIAQLGHNVKALAIDGMELGGVELIRYRPARGSTPNIHPWASDLETKLIRGEACAATAERLKAHGYRPDVIVGHPGWGEMLFLRDIWPHVPQLHFLEFYYKTHGADVSFDPEFATNGWQAQARLRAKNANGQLNLEVMDAAYSPTFWQRSSYPSLVQDRISVIHDGVDTDLLTPSRDVELVLGADQMVLRPGMKIVTFINRNFEPYRGYHSFMRSIPRIQAKCPDAIIIMVGADGVSYGAKPPEGQTWKQLFLDEVADRVDVSRIRFVGSVPYQTFVALMRLSAAHVYLTYPFVLSWSMLEAMSCGALVIGSSTEPVQEVIDHGQNGLLVDFFDYDNIADRVVEALERPERFMGLRHQARQTIVERYDLRRICLPRQGQLIAKVAGR